MGTTFSTRCIAGLFVFASFVSVAPVMARDSSGEVARQIDVGGVTRSYLVHRPGQPAPRGGYPVVIAFHGGGGNGAKMVKLMKLDPIADARGFIVVYPDGIGGHWNDGRSSIKTKSDDVGFISALLDRVERDYPVDKRKVFAVGVSNGAVFSHRIGCELSGRISAIAAVSGTMSDEFAQSCRPERPVSLLQISGTADPIMPYDGGKVKQFLGAGEGGTVLSARATVGLWARADGCGRPLPPTQLPPRSQPDGTSITRTDFAGCRQQGRVTLLTVVNGGHAWPGGRSVLPRLFGKTTRQLDASRAVVDFFLPGRGA